MSEGGSCSISRRFQAEALDKDSLSSHDGDGLIGSAIGDLCFAIPKLLFLDS